MMIEVVQTVFAHSKWKIIESLKGPCSMQSNNRTSSYRDLKRIICHLCCFLCIVVVYGLYWNFISIYFIGLSDDPSKNRIPNVLVIGAQKGATTSIASYLWSNACFALKTQYGTRKEAQFFNNIEKESFDLQYYQGLYTHCSAKGSPIIIDATPNTFLFPELVYKTYKEQAELTNDPTILSNLKIIMTLRDPVDRELSWYYHRARLIRKKCTSTIFGNTCPQWIQNQKILKADGTGIKPFDEVMNQSVIKVLSSGDTLDRDERYGLYSEYLKLWFKYFDRKSQILLLSFDELKTDQPSFLRRINEFLNLPVKNEQDLSIEHLNKSPRVPERKKEVSRKESNRTSMCDTLIHLKYLYNASIHELYDLLENNPGPPMEQRPFPKLKFNTPCWN